LATDTVSFILITTGIGNLCFLYTGIVLFRASLGPVGSSRGYGPPGLQSTATASTHVLAAPGASDRLAARVVSAAESHGVSYYADLAPSVSLAAGSPANGSSPQPSSSAGKVNEFNLKVNPAGQP